MNAHAVVMRYARVPLVLRPPYLPSASSQRRARAPRASNCRSGLSVLVPSANRDRWRWMLLRALSASALSIARAFAAANEIWKSGTHLVRCAPIDARTGGWFAAAAATGAIAALAIINNEREQPFALAMPSNETVAYRHAAVQGVAVEDEDEPVADGPEDAGALSYPRSVHTIKFVNAGAPLAASAQEGNGRIKVGAFVAFAGTQSAGESAAEVGGWPSVRQRPGSPNMDEVDRYLWEVYERTPTKRDHSGDFTWKDPAAAKRMGLSLPEYAISGMDPDFREQLYHAGHAMDAAGIPWSMLSAFRDDYRQRLAAGFKARVGRSLHGGSGATGGWGHGRAVDLTSAGGDASAVWHWIDENGAKFGLYRPIPGPDPAHTQSRGDWHKLALGLRETRLRVVANAPAEAEGSTPKKVAKAGL